MGEEQNRPFQLSFNASLRVDFQGSRVTSDGGLILIRELDERLGFGEHLEQYLTDSRAQNAHYDWLLLAQGHLSRRLFGTMLSMIAARQTGAGQEQHSGSTERPKRAALPPQKGQRRLRLTRRGWKASLWAQEEAQNRNSRSIVRPINF
jgi:hypothetical protein